MDAKKKAFEISLGSAEARAQQAIEALVDLSPRNALSLITANFVGLLSAAVKQAGEDPEKEIHVDGGASRSITVHAAPVNNAMERGQEYSH